VRFIKKEAITLRGSCLEEEQNNEMIEAYLLLKLGVSAHNIISFRILAAC
jgi:hypothetical protein